VVHFSLAEKTKLQQYQWVSGLLLVSVVRFRLRHHYYERPACKCGLFSFLASGYSLIVTTGDDRKLWLVRNNSALISLSIAIL